MKMFKLLLVLALVTMVYTQSVNTQMDDAPGDIDTDAPDTMVPAGGEITYLKEQIASLLTDMTLPASAKQALVDVQNTNTVDELLAGIRKALTDNNLSATQQDFLNTALTSVKTPPPTTNTPTNVPTSSPTNSPPVPITPVPPGEEEQEMLNAINAVLASSDSNLRQGTKSALTGALNGNKDKTAIMAAISVALKDPGLSGNDRSVLVNALKSNTAAPATLSPGTPPTQVPAGAVGEYLKSNIDHVLNDPTLPAETRAILQAASESDDTSPENYRAALKLALENPNLTQSQKDELSNILAAAGVDEPTAAPSNDDDGLPWWLLLIPCVLLFLVCLVGVAVFMKRRTRDSFHDGVAAAIPPSAADAAFPSPEMEKEGAHVAFTPQAQTGPSPAEPFVQTPAHPDIAYSPTPSPSDAAASAGAALAGPALVAPSPRWSTRGAYNPRVRNPPSASPVQDRLRPLPEDDDIAAGGVLGGVAFPGPPKPAPGARNFVQPPKYRPSPVRAPGGASAGGPDHYDHIEI